MASLVVNGRDLLEGASPLLMGVVNATPDSFSDGGESTTEQRLARACELLDAGADVIDIGGESGITGVPPVSVDEEIERVMPLVQAVAGEISTRGANVAISIDTYKPQVARAAIEAGAEIINDVSGLRSSELAEICAQTGAGLVIMHTRAAPKQRLQDADLYEDVFDDVHEFLKERMELALSLGVDREQIVLDPGPDFSKTPAQTVSVLRRLDRLSKLDRPLLLAISRKDFIGAINKNEPRERLAGTLAALAHGLAHGGEIFRVHDVRAAREFIDVLDVLNGNSEIPDSLALADELRWQA